MKQVNMHELYPDTYDDDEYVEVSDEVYEALCEFENEEEAYHRRKHRNKAIYSLDAGDGIENDATSPPQTPEEIVLERETREELLSLMTGLTDKQARRIYKRLCLGFSVQEIAEQERVSVKAIYAGLQHAIQSLKNSL